MLKDVDDGVRDAADSAIARFKFMKQSLFDVRDNTSLARSADAPVFMPFLTPYEENSDQLPEQVVPLGSVLFCRSLIVCMWLLGEYH